MFPLALLLAASGPAQSPVPQPGPGPLVFIPPSVSPPTVQIGRETPKKCDLPDIADCLRACPPANDAAPFLRVPKVTPVEECRGTVADVKCDPAHVWKHTWHAAARFKVPRFDQGGQAMEGDSLVIYEGMVLSVNTATGVYDLSFTATTPPTAVTLRLQLQFSADPAGQEAIRLTLPPIRIDTDETARSGDNSGRTVRIQHRGQSELFVSAPAPGVRLSESTDLFPKPPVNPSGLPSFQFHLAGPQTVTVTDKWTIGRTGTARFGSARINADDQDR